MSDKISKDFSVGVLGRVESGVYLPQSGTHGSIAGGGGLALGGDFANHRRSILNLQVAPSIEGGGIRQFSQYSSMRFFKAGADLRLHFFTDSQARFALGPEMGLYYTRITGGSTWDICQNEAGHCIDYAGFNYGNPLGSFNGLSDGLAWKLGLSLMLRPKTDSAYTFFA
ncbi:MAG: hypothetical protein KDK66_08775, partial [Deltaproteobacteria bacterium]|nr:hypothetical protein [Deltaproteobacteria bacterium]